MQWKIGNYYQVVRKAITSHPHTGQLNGHVLIQKHVFGLQVSVDNIVEVTVFHRREDLHEFVSCHLLIQVTILCYVL